jgi:hypothetical protein
MVRSLVLRYDISEGFETMWNYHYELHIPESSPISREKRIYTTRIALIRQGHGRTKTAGTSLEV